MPETRRLVVPRGLHAEKLPDKEKMVPIDIRHNRLEHAGRKYAGEKEIIREPDEKNIAIYMSLSEAQRGLVQFLEIDHKTSIGPSRRLAPDIVRELVERLNTPMNPETQNALDKSISDGHGGIYLRLNLQQYLQLKNGTKESF
jgi:hypothetical protein